MDQLSAEAKYINLMETYQAEVRACYAAKEALDLAHLEKLQFIERIAWLESENEQLRKRLERIEAALDLK